MFKRTEELGCAELEHEPEGHTHTHPFELVSDPDVWYVFQQGKTGGFCAPGVVRVKANYPAMGDEYDPSLPEGIIVYIDETSQYPATASKYPLPGRNFKLLTDRDALPSWWPSSTHVRQTSSFNPTLVTRSTSPSTTAARSMTDSTLTLNSVSQGAR